MSQDSISRRTFLGGAASAAAFTIVPSHVLGGTRGQPPSEKLNIAGIGVGGMGHVNLNNLATENIVALCDVDHNYAAKSIQKFPDARLWSDYREMLEEQKDIEALGGEHVDGHAASGARSDDDDIIDLCQINRRGIGKFRSLLHPRRLAPSCVATSS